MEYLEDDTDTGQLENGLYKFRCIQDHKAHTILQTLSTLEVSTFFFQNCLAAWHKPYIPFTNW